MAHARQHIPGFAPLAADAAKKLPRTHDGDGRSICLLHGHVLDQTSLMTQFADHQDTDEDRARGQRNPDRRVLYTVVIKLSRGGATSMRILGQDAVVYEAHPGTGVLFLSELWHRTETASPGTTKLTLFFGVWF